MRLNKFWGLGLSCSLTLLLGGIISAPANHYVPRGSSSVQGDGIPRITPAEVQDLVRRRRAIIVDVRSLEAYRDRHIKGSISIPVDQIEARLKELPRGKTIATYCS